MSQTPPKNHRKITQYARHFFSGTLLSRISGMVRDMSMAAIFGDHPSVASFMVAFRFSHFLRRLLGEGSLQSIFIPHYEELRLQNAAKAKSFFFQITLLLAGLLFFIVLLGEGITYFLLKYPVGAESEVLHLFAWMFPSLLFICLYGLNISLLQCEHSFFLSSVAPFVCNVIWIASLFLFAKNDPSQAMGYVALFTVIGFIIQWGITLPKIAPTFAGGRKTMDRSLFSIPSEIRSVGKATLLGLIGVVAVQLNSFLDMLFAQYADPKGPIYLWYAIRLQQLPLALIGFSAVYSIVPSLSRAIKGEKVEETHSLYRFGISRIYFLMIPCSFAVLALGFASINLLFGHGHFSQEAVLQTTWCLWAYACGLLPATLTIYQASLFYAYHDFKIPMIASLGSVALSVFLNALFVFALGWGAISIALSTSASAWFNYVYLKISFKKHPLEIRAENLPLWPLSIAGCVALGSVMLYDHYTMGAFFYEGLRFHAPRVFIAQASYLIIQTLLFIGIFGLSLLCLTWEKRGIYLEKFMALRKKDPLIQQNIQEEKEEQIK